MQGGHVETKGGLGHQNLDAQVLSPSILAPFIVHYGSQGVIKIDKGSLDDGVNLVVGDSVDDRLLFWNGHHHYHEVYFNEITSLRIPAERQTDVAFLTLEGSLIVGTMNEHLWP